GEVPTFKFSVGVGEAENSGGLTLAEVLQDYEIRLLVDTDATAATEFIVLNAQATEGDSDVPLNWEFADSDLFTGDHRLEDDEGTDHVSQNIQALGWFQPDDAGNIFVDDSIDPGTYSVVIEVYEQGGAALVGATELTFQVAEPV